MESWLAGALAEALDALVVLVAIDAAGFDVLLVGEDVAVLAGEAAIILGPHAALFAVDAAFLMLQPRGFAGGELTASYALADAVLLVVFPLIDGGGPAVGLGEKSGWRDGECCS